MSRTFMTFLIIYNIERNDYEHRITEYKGRANRKLPDISSTYKGNKKDQQR